MMVDDSKNIKIGALISYSALFLNILINLFYTPFLLKSVGDVNYGLWSFVTSITSWFTVGVYAIYDSYVKFSTEEKKKIGNEGRINTIYSKILALLSVVIFIAASVIIILLKTNTIGLEKYSNEQKHTIIVLFFISTIQVLAMTMLSLYKLFCEYRNCFIFVKTISLGVSIVSTVLSVISLILNPSIIIVAVCITGTNILAFISYFAFAKTKLKMTFYSAPVSQNKEVIKQVVSFSAFLLIYTIVAEINSSVDKTLLGIFAGANYVTIYQLGMTFNSYFSELSMAINSVFVPKLNLYAIENKTDKVNNLYINISRIQTILLCCVIGGFACCGKEFVSTWVGKERIEVYYVALTVLILSSFEFGNISSLSIQRAYAKHKTPALINLIVTILNVFVSIVMLMIFPDRFAIVACLIGTAVSYIVGKWVLIPIYNGKVIGLPICKYYKIYIKYFSIALLSAILSKLCFSLIFKKLVFNSMLLQCVGKGLLFLFFYIVLVLPSNWNFFRSVLKRDIS